MAEPNPEPSEALRAAAEKRVELKQALSRAEIAASAPSADPGWRQNLLAELENLQVALFQHVEEVEAADGLLPELTQLAPRLANQIGHVQDEHPVLCRQCEEAIAHTKTSADAGSARVMVVDLLNAIILHRQKGADLVYEGYSVDIGGS